MADASHDSASKTSWTGLADRMLACALMVEAERPLTWCDVRSKKRAGQQH
jgi:hypothetical protein